MPGKTTAFTVPLRPAASAQSKTAVVSLPLPPFNVGIEVEGAAAVQSVPLGEWPAREMVNPRQVWPWPQELLAKPAAFGNPPRRALVYATFPNGAPDQVSVRLLAGRPAKSSSGTFPFEVECVPGKETYLKREFNPGLYHYVKREDSVRLRGFGREMSLRLGFRVGEEVRYWQWCTTLPVWQGPLTTALVVGGHIYAGPVDRPMTLEEGFRPYTTTFENEDTICAKAFIVAHADGLVEVTVHFANIQGYGMGTDVKGLPVVELAAVQGGALNNEMLRVSEGECNLASSGDHWRWQPVADSRIYLGRREDRITKAQVDHYVNGSDTFFVKGVGRSATMSLCLQGAGVPPRRYLAAPAWYKRCAEFGVALPDDETTDFAALQRLSDAGVRVFLRNVHPHGMSRGGVYRYLDELQGRHELSMDGNESSYLFRGAYMRGSGELFNVALDSARHIADVCIDHNYFNVHYHGDEPTWKLFSLIYLRFGGLVQAWQETGDPWYLETAEAVANRWIAVNRANQPRKNMGRDTEPIEGVMMLYDATGKDHYFQEAAGIARDTANSLYDDNMWRSGFGVGPFWGTNALLGSPWNGSHLLAGIEEFLARACPETTPDYDALMLKARALVAKCLDLVRTDCKGFHRATGSFMPRRHFLVAYMSGDEALTRAVLDALRVVEAEFERDGEKFYKTGHHCGGYVEAPYVLRSLADRQPPWARR